MTMEEVRDSSEGSTAVSGPPDPPQAGPSNGSTSRPIHSYFGGSNGSASSGPSQTDKPKKRRKKSDDAAQGTLSRTGEGWSIARQKADDQDLERTEGVKLGESSSQVVARNANGVTKKARGKGRSGLGDEEAEMKDMSRGRSKAPAGKRKKVDSSYIGGSSPDPMDDLQVSDVAVAPTRKSPRKPKTDAQPSRREIIHLSSDPPEPLDPPPQPRTVAQLRRKPFSRTVSTASTTSKGAHHDPIDVDEVSGPRKIVFAADQKTTHSFFSRRPTQDATLPLADKPVNGDKPVHAFFANAPASGSTPGELRDGWGRGVKVGQEWMAPLPGGPVPTHVGGSSMRSDYIRAPSRKLPSIIDDTTTVEAFWKTLRLGRGKQGTLQTGFNGTTIHSPSVPPSVIPMIAAHPAMSTSQSLNTREPWTELFAPQSPARVLGNEVEAEYLLAWLQALSVGSTKRQVFRKVARTKVLDGWIVDDLTPFSEGPEEEEYDTFYEPPLALGQRPLSYPPLEDRLAGCMLLTGTSGTGKSAAVYAAAKELGWEVFEVNPGMGKRTGAGLMSWIGDVGKNHLVQQNNHDEHDLMLANGSTSLNRGAKKGHKRGQSGEYRQSVILIEEADILFQEEQTFWPTIISLIAGSRRPVILTCNDRVESSRIPIESLPLQAILYFHPPPSYLAIPYLEALAAAQGVSPHCGVELYHSCVISNGPKLEQPLPPNGHEPIKRFDLRKAITQLQLDRGRALSLPTVTDEVHEFARVETASFVDAFVAPRPSHAFETEEIDRHEPGIDDELGIAHLVKPMISDHVPVLLGYDRCREIIDYLVGAGGSSYIDFSDQRTTYIRSTLPFLDPLIPLSAPLLPRSSLFTDTIPTIQSIVRADDILEQAEDLAAAQGQVRLDKKTGRPRRSGGKGDVKYQRWFELDRQALQAVRGSVWAQ